MQLTRLNPEQQEGVLHDAGPLLILAGAGSGKTRVITTRIAYLIAEKHVSPRSILALTFTNKAAREMKERVFAMLGKGKQRGLTVSTFHAFGVYLLRRHIDLLGYREKFSIFNTADKLQLLTEIIQDKGLDPELLPAELAGYLVSNAKNSLLLPNQAEGFFDDPEMLGVYKLYQETLRGFNIVDFDDLLLLSVHLLRTHPDILETYSKRFRYIMVDEYQDTNAAQYQLLRLLTKKNDNICVVGDDDQSIYAWRGADISNIMEFEKDFPGALVIKLEQNYRSTRTILGAANSLITSNTSRKGKQLWSAGAEGETVKVICADDEQDEAMLVRDKVIALHRELDVRYRDIALVFRTNFQTRPFEEVFSAYGIPYQVIGGTRFYDRKEAKDVISYLRFLANRNDEMALLRIINTPKRKIGPKTMQKIINHADLRGMRLYQALQAIDEIEDIPDTVSNNIGEFLEIIEEFGKKIFKSHSMVPVVRELIAAIRYEEELLRDAGKDEKKYHRSIAFVQGVIRSIAVFEQDDDIENHDLFHYLERISLLTSDDQEESSQKQDAVTLLTMHACKGLEFPHVFVTGVEEGNMPHSRSLEDAEENIEEERRLFYVAITRAMKTLTLSYAGGRHKYGEYVESIPSRFLEEIDSQHLEFSEPGAEDFESNEDMIEALASMESRYSTEKDRA